jgi:hypothetical protein
MATTASTEEREYGSGEIVEPGYYVDLETGTIVQVRETDELPEGNRVVRYRRRFRRVPAEALKAAFRRAGK